MKPLIFIILSIVFSSQLLAQKIHFKRGCNGASDNNLYWQIIPDTCTLSPIIKLYGTDIISLPFAIIDGNINSASLQYTHVSANSPQKKDWHYFFEYTVICGANSYTFHTDTLTIDTAKPEATFLDSVSVDPLTNSVILGWSSNKTPDFNGYYLYNTDRSNPILAQNYRDTFYIDNGENPKVKSLTYDITSSDSCDNVKEYNSNPHKTIYLSLKIDTCKNDASLNWSLYVGWPVIRMQYLYRNINSSGYVLIDSITPPLNSYTDKGLKNNSLIEYFIRAFKLDPTRVISSTSNSVGIISGKSVNPTQTQIKYVTNNLTELEVSIKPNPLANYSSIDLYKYSGQQSPVKIYSFSVGESLYQDISSSNKTINNYFLVSKNTCGQIADSSLNSNNIVLNINPTDVQISLNWNRYFTWNDGVKEYIIFRATGDKINEAINFSVLKSASVDTFSFDPIDASLAGKVLCYYIQAIENDNITDSKSDIVCNVKIGDIYFPNAIMLSGVNKHFSFIGVGLDLSKSSVEIYNRWGSLVYGSQDLSNGWDGTNFSGQIVDAGVYYFIAHIKQGEEIKDINGNITVIK